MTSMERPSPKSPSRRLRALSRREKSIELVEIEGYVCEGLIGVRISPLVLWLWLYRWYQDGTEYCELKVLRCNQCLQSFLLSAGAVLIKDTHGDMK